MRSWLRESKHLDKSNHCSVLEQFFQTMATMNGNDHPCPKCGAKHPHREYYDSYERALVEFKCGTVITHAIKPSRSDDAGYPIFAQKGVDLLMGLEIANLASRERVQCMTLLTGDSDFIPAVELIQSQAIFTGQQALITGGYGTQLMKEKKSPKIYWQI